MESYNKKKTNAHRRLSNCFQNWSIVEKYVDTSIVYFRERFFVRVQQ